MKMAGAKQKNKGGKSKVKNLKKMGAKNNEMLKKGKTSMSGDVEMTEVTETQNTGKNNEKKQNEKGVATETRKNKIQMKKENEQQKEAKMEQENKNDAEGVGGQVKAKSRRRKMTAVKENQENKENANQGENANTGKRKREPEGGENEVPISKKKKINLAQKDKCTLFIRFPESLVVKRQSHVKAIVGINVVNIRFPNVPRGMNKGFCYAEFKSQKEAKITKKKLEKKQVNGESLHVEYLPEKTSMERAQTSKTVDPLSLYVGRLPRGVREEDLRAVFPTAVKIKKQKSRSKFRHSIHAYVTFKTMEEAQKAIEASKGLKVGDSEVLVMFATSLNNKSSVKKEKKSDSKLSSPAKKIKVEDVEMADDAKGDEGNSAK